MKYCPKCNKTYGDDSDVCLIDNTPLNKNNEDPLLGTILDNRFKLTEIIGWGGMGRVYKAEHIILGKPFALKVLNPELANREDAIKRFINEAKLTSKLGHPNIVEVTDFGTTPTGSFYFAMEYIRGKTLYELLSQQKIIPPKHTINILTQCADALYAAHCEGIIHRDLKPDNIMLINKEDDSYFVKILDFGISKIAGELNTKLTSCGVIIGTPEYISPEQASQETVDHRSDIYSLGVIMYQMLAGNLPFTSTNPLNLLMMHKTKSPKPIKSYNPLVPPPLESICLRCLSKNPSDRFRNMRELKNALQEALKQIENVTNVSSSIEVLKDNENHTSKTNDLLDIPPPTDIPLDKIHEVRSQLFVDSNSVWFDPYSKPKDTENKEILNNNEKLPSIVIDTSALEKSIEIDKNHENLKMAKDEEILLVTEVSKQKPFVAKQYIPYAKKASTSKNKEWLLFESILTKRNIIIFVSSMLTLSFIIGILVYKSVTSGIDEELKREIKFNTPLPINPKYTKQEQENAEIENKNKEIKMEKSDQLDTDNQTTPRSKISSTRQEKPPPQLDKNRPQTAKEYFIEANNYFRQGKYDLAAEYYKAAIRLNPNFAMAYRGLGACYAMLGKADLSIKQYEKYIELDPNGPDVDKVINIINEYKGYKK